MISMKTIDTNAMMRMEETHYFRSVSRYDINNALLKKYMPLSDHIHGPIKIGAIIYLWEWIDHVHV
jgi:hypothetical protein